METFAIALLGGVIGSLPALIWLKIYNKIEPTQENKTKKYTPLSRTIEAEVFDRSDEAIADEEWDKEKS